MKLSKVSSGESENEKSIMGNLLTTDEGVLPELASILNWCRNLSLFPEVTFPDICNCLAEKTNKYSMEKTSFLLKARWDIHVGYSKMDMLSP